MTSPQSDMANLEHAEFLQRPYSGGNDFSSLSSPVECPSLSESFLSTTTPVLGETVHRRWSFDSFTASSSPGWSSTRSSNATCPTTPATTSLESGSAGSHHLKFEHDLENVQMYNLAQYNAVNLGPWIHENHESLPLESITQMTQKSSMQLMDALGFPTDSGTYHECLSYPHSIGLNPSLSRPIFGVEEGSQPMLLGDSTGMRWSEHVCSPLQTIAPSAAFQPLLTSSPARSHELSTPCRKRMFSSDLLSSSPVALVSPPIVPSQQNIDLEYELAEHTSMQPSFGRYPSTVAEEYWAIAITPEKRHGRPTMHRRSYERKSKVGSSHKPRSAAAKSGINCEAIIAQNEFACSYPNCIDKTTSKQKRFKRAEHKKRHEKTVHEKHQRFPCWVPGCKTNAFSRSDNLQSHLRNTHGKKSPNQRNDYVATLDKDSEYYNPEWRGELDSKGYPIYKDEAV